MINQQEKSYARTVNEFIQVKEIELNAVLQQLKDKNSTLTSREEEVIELKRMIVISRQDLVEKENQRLDAEKRIREVKEKMSSLLHDKKFYLQKIVDQREELKNAKLEIDKKDKKILKL